MKELCVPVSALTENDIAEITVRIKGTEVEYLYKVESFPWDTGEQLTPQTDKVSLALTRIYRLKEAIESYDKAWELIQIYTPVAGTDHIQVLFRKKS